MELGNIEEYLQKFRIHYPKSLFEPTPAELKYYLQKFVCPICFRRLRWDLKKDWARCKSMRNDKFKIRSAVLEKYIK